MLSEAKHLCAEEPDPSLRSGLRLTQGDTIESSRHW